MWPDQYSERLSSWADLRSKIKNLELDDCLLAINQWWFDLPWTPYSLHWDDRTSWPDPWQLIQDDKFCDLARGLGIIYTIHMLDRDDLHDCVLFEHKDDNLVLVHDGKYILNWCPDTIVNINLGCVEIKNRRSINRCDIKSIIV
jgi:hypothetical protein